MKINLNELDVFSEDYEMVNSYFSSNKRQKKSQKKIKKIRKDSWNQCMEQKKNKDKLVSKQKKQQEVEKKPELSRKEAFLKDLKDVIMKHDVDHVNYCKKSGRPSIKTINNQLNYPIEAFTIDSKNDNIVVDAFEILTYIGCDL